jgi:hypothetical protein
MVRVVEQVQTEVVEAGLAMIITEVMEETVMKGVPLTVLVAAVAVAEA